MSNNRSHSQPTSIKIKKLAAQIAKDPRSKDFIPLAEEYVKAGMLQEAALTLEDGLKVYPSFVTVLVKLGGVYVQLQEWVKAQNRLEEAIKNSPDNLLAHRMLAKLYVSNNNSERAIQSCEKVLCENPYDKEMLELKLVLEQVEPNLSETELQHRRFLNDAPESLHTPNDQPSTLVPESESALPYSGRSDAPLSHHSEIPEHSTLDRSQQQVKKLSYLLERIHARRAS